MPTFLCCAVCGNLKVFNGIFNSWKDIKEDWRCYEANWMWIFSLIFFFCSLKITQQYDSIEHAVKFNKKSLPTFLVFNFKTKPPPTNFHDIKGKLESFLFPQHRINPLLRVQLKGKLKLNFNFVLASQRKTFPRWRLVLMVIFVLKKCLRKKISSALEWKWWHETKQIPSSSYALKWWVFMLELTAGNFLEKKETDAKSHTVS